MNYDDAVNQVLLLRFRIVIGVGIGIYAVFSLLDHALYPEWTMLFLAIRSIVIAIFIGSSALSRYPAVGRHIIWLADVVLILGAAGLSAMVIVTGGAKSPYYQGIVLMLLGMFTLNNLRPWHNLSTGCFIIGVYLGGVFLSPEPFDSNDLISPLFHLTFLFALIVTMTFLFARQHRSEFNKSAELAASARALAQANEALRISERHKDRFFANMSHEFRTPLTLILGPIRKHLATNDLPPGLAKDLVTVERNAMLLLKHIEDLLAIAQLDAKKTALVFREVDLSQLLSFALSHFEGFASEQNITVALNTPGPLSVLCDPDKILRIFLNVLGNAFQYTPMSGTMEVSAHSEGDKVIVRVSDSGPGVAPSLRPHIFTRFLHGDDADLKPYGGTGLGLAISQEFLALHQGTIELEDEPTALGGASFKLQWPKRPVASHNGAMSDLMREQVSAGNSPAGGTGGTLHAQLNLRRIAHEILAKGEGEQAHILVVEDNPDMHDYIAHALAGEGELARAYNGKQGLELALRLKPELIITDIMMPTMSGSDFIHALRSHPEHTSVPILVLTAKSDTNLRLTLLNDGAQDFVTKPFIAEELRARARNLLVLARVRKILEEELTRRDVNIVAMTKALAASRKVKQKALRHAQEAAMSKDVFLMNLSHELRTPMTAILAWINILLEDDTSDPSECLRAYETIKRNAETQLGLVNDLLDTSWIFQDRLRLDVSKVEVANLISAAVAAVSDMANSKGITIHQTLPMLPLLWCDRARIIQVLRNLLSNAIKFSPAQGQISISADVTRTTVRIRVQDHGEGLEPSAFGIIFEPLRQVDDAMNRRHGGLGLGLAIAKRLVEMHKGAIWVESQGRGQGSIFTVEIPIGEQIYAKRLTEKKPPVMSPRNLQGLKVVLLEDDAATSDFLASVLHCQGASVLHTADLHDVRCAAANDQDTWYIYVVDLDMTLPDDAMPVREQLKILRESSLSLPVIALSQHLHREQASENLGPGPSLILEKPVLAHELLEGIDRLLAED